MQARRFNEHLKLAAAAVDRLSTVVLGGAVLAPIFQHAWGSYAETTGWMASALVLHLMAQAVLRFLKEEV